jgi:ABC-type bacteriocin/lantibiotic exporter with double-glycine peptidase domain
MMIWLGVMLMALLFGIAVSYWSFKYAWVLLVITPFAALYTLIWFEQRRVTHYESAPMQEVLYATLALPAVLVALNSYAVMRARLAKKRQDKLQ